jgi:hypothetical protein
LGELETMARSCGTPRNCRLCPHKAGRLQPVTIIITIKWGKSMPTDNRNQTDKTFETLFGEPPLIEGESKEDYWQLYAMVEADRKPKSIFDKMEVKDTTDQYWEEQRIMRQAADLVEAKMPRALTSMVLRTRKVLPLHWIEHYFDGTEREKKAVLEHLAAQGLTPRHIRAEATELARPGLLAMDRMRTTRATARRISHKDFEKRRANDVDVDAASDTAPPAAGPETKPSVN